MTKTDVIPTQEGSVITLEEFLFAPNVILTKEGSIVVLEGIPFS